MLRKMKLSIWTTDLKGTAEDIFCLDFMVRHMELSVREVSHGQQRTSTNAMPTSTASVSEDMTHKE